MEEEDIQSQIAEIRAERRRQEYRRGAWEKERQMLGQQLQDYTSSGMSPGYGATMYYPSPPYDPTTMPHATGSSYRVEQIRSQQGLQNTNAMNQNSEELDSTQGAILTDGADVTE